VTLAIFWYLLTANAEAAEYCGGGDLATMVASTNQRIDNMDKNLKDELKTLNRRIDTMETRMEERMEEHRGVIEGRLNTMAGPLITMDEKLTSFEGKLDGKLSSFEAKLDGRLTSFQGKLDGIERRLDGVDERLAGVEGRLTGLEDKFMGIDDSFTAIQGDIGRLSEGIATIKGTQIWLTNAEIRRENSHVQTTPGSQYRPLHKTVRCFVQNWLSRRTFGRLMVLHPMQIYPRSTSLKGLFIRRE
jgi:chromosome segregation ATPase